MNTNEGQARYEWLQAINYKTNFFLKNEILPICENIFIYNNINYTKYLCTGPKLNLLELTYGRHYSFSAIL